MKRKLILLAIIQVLMFMLTSCIDFEAVIESENAKTEGTYEKVIGDINDDGKIEKVLIDGPRIMLLSGTKILGEFLPDEKFDYTNLRVKVTDIDNDLINEVMVFTSADKEQLIYSANIIDYDNDKGYYIRTFPMELNNINTSSGIEAQIIPQEDYKYLIKCHDEEFVVDVKRVYGLSLLVPEDREKVDKAWQKMLVNGQEGQVVGITKTQMLIDGNGNNIMQVTELVNGSDGKAIGYIVFELLLKADGTYSIESIYFEELLDLYS